MQRSSILAGALLSTTLVLSAADKEEKKSDPKEKAEAKGEKAAGKTDPAGTWTWTPPGRDGGADRKSTLKLETEGEKVTGTLTTAGRQGGDPREVAIEEGKLKGHDVSFAVTREFNGNTMTQKYNGKVSSDTIKGKIEFDRNGEAQSRDWEAKRETAKKD